MIRFSSFKNALFLGLSISCVGAARAETQYIQREAEILAGRPVEGEKARGLYSYYKTGGHQLSNSAQKLIKDFAKKNLTEAVQNTTTVFYPFGGPDVLYPSVFFPSMQNLILIGSEDVGELPGGSDQGVASFTDDVRQVVGTLLNLSFYRTIDMKNEAAADSRLATLTKIVASIAVLDANNISLDKISLGADGEVLPFAPKNSAEKCRAVRIKYNVGGVEKKVYYFQQNLGDYEYQGLKSLSSSPEFINFVNRHTNFTSFYKAASYMSHQEGFSTINNLALRAKYLVQTDTGIPYRAINPEQWNVTLYGNYIQPIPLFKMGPEKALVDALKDGTIKRGGALPFHYDYGSRSQQNIIYGIRRESVIPKAIRVEE